MVQPNAGAGSPRPSIGRFITSCASAIVIAATRGRPNKDAVAGYGGLVHTAQRPLHTRATTPIATIDGFEGVLAPFGPRDSASITPHKNVEPKPLAVNDLHAPL